MLVCKCIVQNTMPVAYSPEEGRLYPTRLYVGNAALEFRLHYSKEVCWKQRGHCTGHDRRDERVEARVSRGSVSCSFVCMFLKMA